MIAIALSADAWVFDAFLPVTDRSDLGYYDSLPEHSRAIIYQVDQLESY
jgi:hypothetical protein